MRVSLGLIWSAQCGRMPMNYARILMTSTVRKLRLRDVRIYYSVLAEMSVNIIYRMPFIK